MGKLASTRREVLRRGAAAIGAATIVGNAGCIGRIGGGGHTDWLPEPGTIRDDDHYSYSVVKYSSLEEHEDEFSSGTDLESIESTWAPADIDWEDVSMSLRFRGMLVLEADFKKDRIVSDFENEDYEEDDQHEDFTVMLGPNGRSAVGLTDETLVGAGFGFGSVEHPQYALEDVIDTYNGDEDRYTDENEDLADLTDALGDGDIVSGSTMEPTETDDPERGRFRNKVADGRQLNVDGAESNGKWVLVFEDENDVDTGDVEDWVEASQRDDGQFENWGDVEVEGDGRVVVIEGVADTDDL